MKNIAILFIIFFSTSIYSAPNDNTYRNAHNGYFYSSSSALCAAALPARVVPGNCTLTETAGVPNCSSPSANGIRCKNQGTYSSNPPCPGTTVQNQPGDLHSFQCAAPKVITGSCPQHNCECPANMVEENGICVIACTLPLVKNPHTKTCQQPCFPETPPPGQLVGVSVSVDSADTCVGGCVVHHDLWNGINRLGYNAYELISYKTAEFCATGDPSPPTVPPPTCSSPNVEVNGRCEPPPCSSWQYRPNPGGACVDKECPSGHTMKCGTVNGAQSCACAGVSECAVGQQKDLYGNCIGVTCPSSSPFNPATGKCEQPATGSQCPDGHEKVGLMCVKDPTSTEPTKSDGDLDGDGQPNGSDVDMDGDGKPNSSDTDQDGDGIPNAADPTPAGPGTAQPLGPGTGPDDDYDGDGTKNSQDSDRDGDGIPNGQDATPDGGADRPPGQGQCNPAIQQCPGFPPPGGGQCNPATQQCGSAPEPPKPGSPVSIGGAFYEKKGLTFPDVWSKFMDSASRAPIVSAGQSFLSVSDVSGSCPVWTIPATFMSESVDITLQCSSEVAAGFRIAGTVFLIVCAWIALRIALLDY